MISIFGIHVHPGSGCEIAYAVDVAHATGGGYDWISRLQLPGLGAQRFISGKIDVAAGYGSAAMAIVATLVTNIDQLEMANWVTSLTLQI